MRKISGDLGARRAERRFFALPEGNYCLELIEVQETDSKEALSLDENGLLVESDSTHDQTFKEATPQIVFTALITTGKFKGRKIVERMPLVGYQKPDGKNDDERIAAGDTVLAGYWVNKDGDRYVSKEATEKCLRNFDDLVFAVMQEEATVEEFVAKVEACEAQCNAKIVITEYDGKQRNRCAGFFVYNESYGIDEAEAEEDAGY